MHYSLPKGCSSCLLSFTIFINAEIVPQACFGSSTIEVPPKQLRVLETAIVNTLWGKHHALRSRELCFGSLWDPLKVHPQWFSILYSFRDLRRILSKRHDVRHKILALFKKRLAKTFPIQGPGPTRTLLMHLTKCGWEKSTHHQYAHTRPERVRDYGLLYRTISPTHQMAFLYSQTAHF